jgi:hypothetical protein
MEAPMLKALACRKTVAPETLGRVKKKGCFRYRLPPKGASEAASDNRLPQPLSVANVHLSQ